MVDRTMRSSRLPMSSLAVLVTLGSLTVPTTAAAETVPGVQTHTLPNGLTVMLREDHSVPLAVVELRSRAGAILDPDGKEGLASLTATMLTYGTPTRTEEQIADQVERLGAELAAAAEKEVFSVGGSVPTIDGAALEAFLRILADATLNASFPPEALDRARNRRLGQLRGLVDNRSALAQRALTVAMYGDHPYARATSGTLKSIGGLTRDDLVAFHASYLVPDDAVIGLSGDFDSEAALALITELFGDARWGEVCPNGGACRRACVGEQGANAAFCMSYVLADGTERANPLPALQVAGEPAAPNIVLVDTGDPTLNQAQIRMGVPMQRRFSDDGWHAYVLAANVLGGDFTARLNARLRVKEGLTYGARWSSQHDDILPGPAYLSTFTSPKDVVRAVRMTLEEIERLRTEPIPSAEIERVQQRMVRGFVFRFETATGVLGEHLDLWLDRLPVSHLETMNDRLLALNQRDLKGVLGDLPSDDRFTLVVVGNQPMAEELEALAKELEGYFQIMTPATLGL